LELELAMKKGRFTTLAYELTLLQIPRSKHGTKIKKEDLKDDGDV